MGKVIYITGAPAAGKSSTVRMLSERAELAVWEYGARLTEYCRQKSPAIGGQEDLRAQSSGLVTPEDVQEVDRLLLEYVSANRGERHVLVDSHPVTKESYGYRVTAFSQEQVQTLDPDEIWVLYATPDVTRDRISADAAGRPLPSEEEARIHTQAQMAVATTYGIMVSCPVYMFDTGRPREQLIETLLARLAK